MSRPIKDGLDYYPHDVNADTDPKIEPLILLYGGNGYAFYFMNLQYIYKSNDICYDISDAETRQLLCNKLKITMEVYEQILQTCLKFGAFDKEVYEKTGCLTSPGCKKRAEIVFTKRDKMRGKRQVENLCEVSDSETPSQSTQSKEKESKEESKDNIKDLSQSDCKNIIDEHKNIFNESRKLYPGIKRGNETEFENFKKKHKDWKEVLPLLKPAVENQIKSKEDLKRQGKFVAEWKHLQTWINQRCWEIEPGQVVKRYSSFSGREL